MPFEAGLSFSLYKNAPVLQDVEIGSLHRRIEFEDVEPDHSLDAHEYDNWLSGVSIGAPKLGSVRCTSRCLELSTTGGAGAFPC